VPSRRTLTNGLLRFVDAAGIATRIHDATRDVLDQRITALEGGAGALACGPAVETAAIGEPRERRDHLASSTPLHGEALCHHALPRVSTTRRQGRASTCPSPMSAARRSPAARRTATPSACTYFPRGAGAVRVAGHAFADETALFGRLANIGDVRSLIVHPAGKSHVRHTTAERAGAVTLGFGRLSVGLAGIEGFIADPDAGFRVATDKP
jgi:O-acetylhomoserine/O-acetylserine sulfhydrylase-like pyridoxal-dependent enzyme